MNIKLRLQTATAILIFTGFMAAVSAQPLSTNPPAVNPATGLPGMAGAPMIDPVTGLPVPPRWIDPSWPDPGIVLTNVVYYDLPLREVVRALRESFKHGFDILPLPQLQHGDTDYSMYPITLELRNVKASDVFNAMNLVFENDQMPLRWQLMLNGDRPTALLRLLPDLAPPAAEPSRMVFFVGELIGDEKSGGMTMAQVVQTISQVWTEAYDQPGAIRFYEPAQLVIVTGSMDQIRFVDQTLNALRRKVELTRKEKSRSTEAKSKTESPSSAGATAPR